MSSAEITGIPVSYTHLDGYKRQLDYLADYTEFHFGEEEKLQEEIGYPGIAEHKKKHEELRQVVKDLYAMLEEQEGPTAAFVESVKMCIRDRFTAGDRRSFVFMIWMEI